MGTRPEVSLATDSSTSLDPHHNLKWMEFNYQPCSSCVDTISLLSRSNKFNQRLKVLIEHSGCNCFPAKSNKGSLELKAYTSSQHRECGFCLSQQPFCSVFEVLKFDAQFLLLKKNALSVLFKNLMPPSLSEK
ncbi:hypothetical protein Tco_0951160 [Tanacetum coccineum]|uniref:Uncharacterized protein n=1 Tax=Tanacetum coccineum TaxID=301880 RepID=A0ABQ5DTS2_9ASTR